MKEKLNGQQLFEKYTENLEDSYGRLLYSALLITGKEKLFQLLEQAEQRGKKLKLISSSDTSISTQNLLPNL